MNPALVPKEVAREPDAGQPQDSWKHAHSGESKSNRTALILQKLEIQTLAAAAHKASQRMLPTYKQNRIARFLRSSSIND